MASSDADVVSRVQAAVRAALDRADVMGGRRPIVVAVSGGADSTCLLDALVEVVPDAAARLVVGHIDHRLRPESNADATYVKGLGEDYGLRSVTLVVDVPALMADERRGLEEAARVGRYRALRELCREVGGVAVVTGHTRDDSVESVLMHLLRGTGRTGLGGMVEITTLDALADGTMPAPPEPLLKAVRPLLGVGRDETVAYCQAVAIPWLTDPTNTDPSLLRNRVRGHLLPVLRTYNTGIDRSIDRLAAVVRDEDELLNDLAKERCGRLVRIRGAWAYINLESWREQPKAIQRRMVRLIAAKAGADDLGFAGVERVLTVAAGEGPAAWDLGGGLTVQRGVVDLIFERRLLR